MYNWLVSGLAIGASIVLYDGSPIIPSINVLWDLVDELGYVQMCLFCFFLIRLVFNCVYLIVE